MIDITEVMEDTSKVRARMWTLWDSMQKGKAKGSEVRSQIAIANVILSGHKVDIAAAAFMGNTQGTLPAPKGKHINGHSRRIAS